VKFIKYLLFVFLVVQISSGFALEQKQFNDFDGNPKSVEEFFISDKWTVLMIWRHDCHICNQEVAGYSFFHEDNQQAQVIGLSTDGMAKKDKAEKFITTHDLSFDNIIGELGSVMSYYQNNTGSRFIGTPSFMVFSPNGELKAAQAGAVPPDVISNFINSQSK
jgi:peroxiredoxin